MFSKQLIAMADQRKQTKLTAAPISKKTTVSSFAQTSWLLASGAVGKDCSQSPPPSFAIEAPPGRNGTGVSKEMEEYEGRGALWIAGGGNGTIRLQRLASGAFGNHMIIAATRDAPIALPSTPVGYIRRPAISRNFIRPFRTITRLPHLLSSFLPGLPKGRAGLIRQIPLIRFRTYAGSC